MRILKVVQSYYPFQEKGGTVVKVRALARGLARRGHQVTVLTADLGLAQRNGNGVKAEPCDWGLRFAEDGVETIYLPVRAHYRALTLNPDVLGFCRASLKNFSLVHFYGLYDLLGPPVSYFCRRHAIPYVIEPMGMYRPIDRGFLLKAFWHRSVGRPFWSNASQIVATSEMEEQELLEDGVPRNKLIVRYNGVGEMSNSRSDASPSRFRQKWGISSDERLIVFLGRLIPRKGADILIESFAQACPQSGCLVIGGPEGETGYRERLEKVAQDRGVGSRVVFTGPLYDEEKLSLLEDADIFVLPSRYENFANTAAEAMACGVPVIVTTYCGIRSLVDGQAGLVIEPKEQALTQAITSLLRDRDLYARFKEGCRRVADQLSWARLSAQMESHYTNAMSSSNGIH